MHIEALSMPCCRLQEVLICPKHVHTLQVPDHVPCTNFETTASDMKCAPSKYCPKSRPSIAHP